MVIFFLLRITRHLNTILRKKEEVLSSSVCIFMYVYLMDRLCYFFDVVYGRITMNIFKLVIIERIMLRIQLGVNGKLNLG